MLKQASSGGDEGDLSRWTTTMTSWINIELKSWAQGNVLLSYLRQRGLKEGDVHLIFPLMGTAETASLSLSPPRLWYHLHANINEIPAYIWFSRPPSLFKGRDGVEVYICL